MLIYEGLLYAAYAILLSIVLSIIIEPIAGRMLENMFWFYSYRFTLKGIFICLLYTSKMSIEQRSVTEWEARVG